MRPRRRKMIESDRPYYQGIVYGYEDRAEVTVEEMKPTYAGSLPA